MEKYETTHLLEELNASIPFFSVDPDRASGSWHAVLGKYSLDECLCAMEYYMANTERPPTVHGIKGYCDRRRKEAEQSKDREMGENWSRQSIESFRNVTGNTRFEKILFVSAEQAAKNWTRDKGNEFYGDLLLKAKVAGIEFDGINYNQIRPTGDADSFLTMAMGQRGE